MSKIAFEHALQALQAHVSADALEESYRVDTISHVSRNPRQWWSRDTASGHVTCSAWILNATLTEVLLLHHAKLERWLQPGGHMDADDPSLLAAALREATEETGLKGLRAERETIFDIDVHTIPARTAWGKVENAHQHYDLRYMFVAPVESVCISEESRAFRWLPLETVASTMNESLARMARKCLPHP